MSFLSELADLAHLESRSDYKVKNPHQGWAVLSMFGPTSETDVAGFWNGPMPIGSLRPQPLTSHLPS